MYIIWGAVNVDLKMLHRFVYLCKDGRVPSPVHHPRKLFVGIYYAEQEPKVNPNSGTRLFGLRFTVHSCSRKERKKRKLSYFIFDASVDW